MRTHNNVTPIKCNIRDIFYGEWRMEKHRADYSEKRKYCHYFNNVNVCPYKEVGCRFDHKKSFSINYCHNPRPSRAELSNLDTYYYPKITTTPPPYGPQLHRAVQYTIAIIQV